MLNETEFNKCFSVRLHLGIRLYRLLQLSSLDLPSTSALPATAEFIVDTRVQDAKEKIDEP